MIDFACRCIDKNESHDDGRERHNAVTSKNVEIYLGHTIVKEAKRIRLHPRSQNQKGKPRDFSVGASFLGKDHFNWKAGKWAGDKKMR